MKLVIRNNLFSRWIFLFIGVIIFLMKVFGIGGAGTVVALFIVITVVFDRKMLSRKNFDNVFGLYIFFCIISGAGYLINGKPILLFFQGISYNLFPALVYLIGAKDAGERDGDAINRAFLGSMFVIVVGLLFYYLKPDYYYSHLGQSLDSFVWGLNDYRYGSFITSLNLGSLCVTSIGLWFSTIRKRNILLNGVFAISILLSLFLSMQRSAWIASAICIIFIVLLSKLSKRRKFVIVSLTVLLFCFTLVGSERIFTTAQIDNFRNRLSYLTVEKMVSTRISQWRIGIDTFFDYPFGAGLGTMGHKAAEAGFTEVVADGNYLRMLSEIGIIGFCTFLILIIRGVKNVFGKQMEILAVLIGFCLQAVGSNVFDLFYSSLFFWYLLGYANHYSSNLRQDDSTWRLIG